MNREQIKSTREKLRKQIQKHEHGIEILRARMKVLQSQCLHPKQFNYTAMGDPGVKCPDCGYQT
jgi:hypothetical protein